MTSFKPNFWIYLCKTWSTFYSKFIVTGELRKLYSFVPKCIILLCLKHIVTVTTLVLSPQLTRQFSVEGILWVASVMVSFFNLTSRIIWEERLNEKLLTLDCPVSITVEDSLNGFIEGRSPSPLRVAPFSRQGVLNYVGIQKSHWAQTSERAYIHFSLLLAMDVL